MKVFLSYASEQKELADHLAERLKSAGVGLFFDRENLAAGDSFDTVIRRAIAGVDVFVFLASPEALRAGVYTLTELGFARERWPAASGRVITVLLAGTTIESLPAYLRSVSVLVPEGDAIAETVAAVSKSAERLRRQFWKRLAGAGAAVLLLVALGLFAVWKAPLYEIRDASVRTTDGKFRFTATLRNSGTEAVTTVNFYPEADKTGIIFPGSMEWFEVAPGEARTTALVAEVAGGNNASPFNWRLCWVLVKSFDLNVTKGAQPIEFFIDQHSQTVCSRFRPWPL